MPRVVIVHPTEGRAGAREYADCGGNGIGRLGCKCVGVVHPGRSQTGEGRSRIVSDPGLHIVGMHAVDADYQYVANFVAAVVRPHWGGADESESQAQCSSRKFQREYSHRSPYLLQFDYSTCEYTDPKG